jgi:hypothetical protein
MSLAARKTGSQFEFWGAVLPLIVALTTLGMVLLSVPLTGAVEDDVERLVEQNQLLMGLVCLLSVAVLGLAAKNVHGLKK